MELRIPTMRGEGLPILISMKTPPGNIRRPPGHRSPQHPREDDEGREDDPDDSDEGNGAVNVRHDGHRIPRNEKAAGSISSGPLGSKIVH
jgi:hypothetical protein